jgi:glycosyltransferase involved in cell wall biosynthesis
MITNRMVVGVRTAYTLAAVATGGEHSTPCTDSSPLVAVVIPAKNAARTLGHVLDDLGTVEQAQVVVVDDGSTDTTAEVAATFGAQLPHFVLLRGPGRGPAAARNAGARASNSAWLAFIDADIRLPPEWMSAGLAAIEGGHDVIEGIVQPRGGATAGLVRHSAMSKGREQFVTANLWVRREVFDRVGGFDEAYTAPWREDTDLGWSLLQAGARSTTAPDLVVYHPYYRRPLRSLFREGVRIDADTRLRKKFPERSRRLQPSRRFRRSYAATALLLISAGSALAGAPQWGAVGLAVSEVVALTAVIPVVEERGRGSVREWLGLALVALPLTAARTWWATRSNARMRTWFW